MSILDKWVILAVNYLEGNLKPESKAGGHWLCYKYL